MTYLDFANQKKASLFAAAFEDCSSSILATNPHSLIGKFLVRFLLEIHL